MSAVRRRKGPSGPQQVDRRMEQQEVSPGSSAPHPSSVAEASARGKKEGSWTAPLKPVRRRRVSGQKVAPAKEDLSGIGVGSEAREQSVPGLGRKAVEGTGTSVSVPVSAEFQQLSETFPVSVQSINPFAPLNLDVGDSNLVGNRDVCPGPLKRARPVEYLAPRFKSKSNKKNVKGGATASKSKQAKVRVEQLSKVDQGTSEDRIRESGGLMTQSTLVSDTSCDPSQVVFQGQGSVERPSNTYPQSSESHEGLSCQSQSPVEDIRSLVGLPDRVMVDVQGGSQLPPPDK